MPKMEMLLFVDANIWLDFYRSRGDVALSLLRHLEKISDKIIVPYQLEMEFKKNRQNAIQEGLQKLKVPDNIPRPGVFSDAKAVRSLGKAISNAGKQVKKIRSKYAQVLDDPAANDPVYKAVQRIFHKDDNLVWKKGDKVHRSISKQAFDRFLHGYPPRKKNDTSMGDALNWEWMIYCATQRNAELVIVSRDSDFGINHGDSTYLNDHLRQEFSERVSRKRKVILTDKLSVALHHFKVAVSPKEKAEEEELLKEQSFRTSQTATPPDMNTLVRWVGDLTKAMHEVEDVVLPTSVDLFSETTDAAKERSQVPIKEETIEVDVPSPPMKSETDEGK